MADVALSKLVEACFNKYDTNKDGKINLVELSDVLGELAREENPLHIMMKYGSEGKIGLHTLIGALENHQVPNSPHPFNDLHSPLSPLCMGVH